MTAPEEISRRTDGPVHTWFELSYSNYAVAGTSVTDPAPVLDNHGRQWVWDPPLWSFVHADDRVMLRSLGQIEAQYGLADQSPAPAGGVAVPVEAHAREDTAVIPAVDDQQGRQAS